MKITEVAAAVIERPGEFLLAQRPEGKPYPGYWEFPGGKIEPGEDAIRVGDRTWVREKDNREGKDIALLAASDGSGRLVIEFACGADFCRGAKGQQMYELVARSIRTKIGRAHV